MSEHFDAATLAVIFVTLVLFVLALFTKGLTHDLFLEAGVFLVSVKLILMGYRERIHKRHLKKELEEIKSLLRDRCREGH